MKKSVLSAITTALVVGAASTAFAASNPFADVPADHWAYDAVSQLAQDGIVDGYAADGTFKGDQRMTRYEMAQIVAKAMAKTPVAANNDKALIDKLSAEFSDELANLGVRVSDLESKVDNVQWGGDVKYQYASNRMDTEDSNGQRILLELDPSMTINDQWTAHAHMEYEMDTNSAHNAMAGNDSPYTGSYNEVTDAYVEGALSDNFTLMAGRMPLTSYIDGGMIVDDHFAGVQAVWGDKFKAIISGGRWNNAAGEYGDPTAASREYAGKVFSYGSLELAYEQDKYSLGAAYHHFGQNELRDQWNASEMGIAELAASYKFSEKVALTGVYAQNVKGDVPSELKKSYSAELTYGEADPETPGSYGFGVAYRYLTGAVCPAPTYDSVLNIGDGNQKGWEVNASYTVAPNVVASVVYFKGKAFNVDGGEYTSQNASKLYGGLEFGF